MKAKAHSTPIAPVKIYRPDNDGCLQHVDTVQPTTTRRGSEYEPESLTYRYRLIAIQETGEEMFVGKATTRTKALDMKYAWLDAHPEHRDVLIEPI